MLCGDLEGWDEEESEACSRGRGYMHVCVCVCVCVPDSLCCIPKTKIIL